MFVFVCFLVFQMSVITWGFTSESRMGHNSDEFICWSSLLLSPWLWCVIQSPPSVFLNLDKLKSKHPLLQSRNSHICLGPHSPFSMIQQVCPRQYGGRGELIIFSTGYFPPQFTAISEEISWEHRGLDLDTGRKSGTKRERLGPMWHVIKSRDNQKNDL